jgi:hypothetical protein
MTQVHSVLTRRGRLLRALIGHSEALRLPDKRSRTLTSNELRLARHMARDPRCSAHDVARAIKWTGRIETLRKKLKAVNIYCVGSSTGYTVGHLLRNETRR